MTDTKENEVIELAKRPVGLPDQHTFRFKNIEMPRASDNDLLLKSIYVSVDPYMRGRMRDVESYVEPFKVDEPISGGLVAEVIKSNDADYAKGDIVQGNLAWKKFQTASPKSVDLRKVDPDLAAVSTSLSTLGMTGLTAYFGLLDLGEPKQGETLVISAAAGAVGSVVAQIGKLKGCRVVGTAGSNEKIHYLENELGVDAGINYKTTDNMHAALEEACPDGVDIYFDNVGGELSDHVISLINKHARMVLCGQIALYNQEDQPTGPRLQPQLLTKSARMEGFIVGNYADRFEEGIQQLASWYHAGQLKHRETVTEGFEHIPDAFIGLFSGDNTGKQVVKVAELN